jgi:putative transcriptional regulator
MIKSTLKVRMAERELAFTALAHQTKITPRTLSNLANNKVVKLDVTVFARLCQVLGCQVGNLMQWVPNGDELMNKPKARGIAANPNAVHPGRRRRSGLPR